MAPEREAVRCANCDRDLSLHERHVRVTLIEDDFGDAARRYLCNESCLNEWVGETERSER
ncbi:DUF7576 family protein [Haloprofundus halobius]|uniref:DUF7576 family protein n=1 Tax=Haloprofundus halobius TaxID=2876194 RepID=UPI003CCDD17D